MHPINNRSKLLGFPKSYAFVIGINHYPLINADLKSAVNDAKALAQVLKQQQGFDHVELLVEDIPSEDQSQQAAQEQQLREGLTDIKVQLSATGATFRNLLARIADPALSPKITPDDCVVFYYAGHGKPGAFEDGPKGYLLPSDAKPERAMLKNDSLVAMEEVFETLKMLDCHHTLLILDCCFAGKFRLADNSRMGRIWTSNMPLYEERFQRYKREKAWQVLVSAGPHQTAADWLGERQEQQEAIHSPFAEALLEALDGKAELASTGKRLGDGVLTSQELFLYLWNKVERLTKDGHLGKKSQYPDLFPMANHQGGQFIFFDPRNKLNFAERVLRNPYQGLRPFSSTVSDLYFGRRKVIAELLPRLAQQSLLVVTGTSGSGKSSLVKAGLLPALRQMTTETNTTNWAEAELLTFCPSSKPWSGATQTDPNDKTQLIYTGLQAVEAQLNAGQPQLLLLDQYEELFTQQPDEAEREQFEQALIRLHKGAASNQLKIILTLRSDYEWLLESSTFGQHFWAQVQLSDFLYRLPVMRRSELREALLHPALAELYEFESDQLVETILAEIGNSPGALPMLSFTMSQFYAVTDKDSRVFTLPAYRALGGVNGALSKYADEVYQSLNAEKQDIMEKLLLRMVKISDGNYLRRRVYVRAGEQFVGNRYRQFLNEFDYPGTQNKQVEEVLQLLEKKQLLLAGSDRIGQYYEPVHDALLQHWQTAKQWIVAFGADNIQLQRQLWQDVVASKESSSPPAAGNAYGAEIEDDLNVDRSLTDNISTLWATNPKLLQIIGQVSYAAKPLMLREKDAIITEALPAIAEEDRATFQKFWNDCYDKAKIPDLNSLILTGYSDKLLDIFLRRGNHWLNEAEADFIVGSWAARIQGIMDVKRQRDEFKAAQQRTAEELIEASWKTGVYLPTNNTDSASNNSYIAGSRDLYARLKLVMSLKKARSLTVIPIFLHGPHQDDINVNAATFGHYNPAFLAWAKRFAIPAKKNKIIRDLTLPFYRSYLQDMARVYFIVYYYLDYNRTLRKQVQADYQHFVTSGQVGAGGAFHPQSGGVFLQQRLRAYPDANEAEIVAELGQLAIYNWGVAGGFWIRRYIDTTAPAFLDILTDLLETYDEEWMNNKPQMPRF